MQNLPLQFPVLKYSLLPIEWWKVLNMLIQSLTRKYEVVFLSQSFASLHAQEGFNLVVEQQEPADPWHQGARQQEDSEDVHALPGGQHPWSMVDRARAGDSVHQEPWHGKQPGRAGTLSQAVGERAWSWHCHGIILGLGPSARSGWRCQEKLSRVSSLPQGPGNPVFYFHSQSSSWGSYTLYGLCQSVLLPLPS